MDANKAIINDTIKKYKQGYKYTPIKNASIDIKTKKNTYKIIRLKDDQYNELYQKSIAVKKDYFHFMDMCRADDLIYSSLSRMYVTLKVLFGESGMYYDDWKCSFSFPFLIKFQKQYSEIDYLFKVMDVKGLIELIFYKLVHNDDNRYENKNIIYESFEELPQEEMIYFMNFFSGYLSGAFDLIALKYNDFFIRTVIGSNIAYGYKDGNFFDERFEDEENFDAFIKLDSRVGHL